MATKESIITVNGVNFTPEMLEMLKEWNLGSLEENEPQYFLRVLSEIQDFFVIVLLFFLKMK